MSRDLPLYQLQNASRVITSPLLLVLWAHSGTEERLSCSDTVTLDGETYSGGIEVSNLVIGESATVVVDATAQRVFEVNAGAYRNQICKIYSISADPQQADAFESMDAVLALDGIISSSGFSESDGTVRASIVHKNLSNRLTPAMTISQVANHIPPAGTVLVSDKQNTELERSR